MFSYPVGGQVFLNARGRTRLAEIGSKSASNRIRIGSKFGSEKCRKLQIGWSLCLPFLVTFSLVGVSWGSTGYNCLGTIVFSIPSISGAIACAESPRPSARMFSIMEELRCKWAPVVVLPNQTAHTFYPSKSSKMWKLCLGGCFLYSGGTDFLEKFTAGFSVSEPVVYKNPPPMGPEILYTTAAGEGVKVSVAIFPSSGGGV